MRGQYVKAETFNEFVCNQKELIKILNHNVSDLTKSIGEMSGSFREVTADVRWIKKTIWWIMGIFSALVIIGLTQS